MPNKDILALIISIIVLVLPVNWYTKAVLLSFMIGLIVYAFLKSPSVSELRGRYKVIITVVIIIFFTPFDFYIIRDQWIKDNPVALKPSVVVSSIAPQSPKSPKTPPPRYAPPAKEVPKEPEKPDIVAELVDPNNFQILLELAPSTEVVVKEPMLTVEIWDLDLMERVEPVIKFTKTLTTDFIRKEIRLRAFRFNESCGSADLKVGHRLFGYMSVSCPDCARTRSYWICGTYGMWGWYSEFKEGQYPKESAIEKLIPEFKKDPDICSHTDIPESSRHPIGDSPC